MRILFVHPPSSNHNDEIALQKIKSSSPSLGLLQLASIARSFGHEVKFFDREFNAIKLHNWIPDLVAITAMTNEIAVASEVASFFFGANIPTVLGGCHVTAEPYNTLIRYPQFKDIIEGEGEWKFTEFIGEDSSKFKTLDDFPDPAFDLINWNKYCLSPFGSKSKRSLGLVTSRGCFGKCTFCSRKVFGNKFRAYSVPRLIEILNRTTFKDFLFYDDLFTGNRARLVEFCEKVIKYKYSWSCCSRVDNLDYETMKLMKRAGCWMIEFGIESGSQEILDRMRKNISLEKIMNTLRETRRAGILSKGNFILGNIGETKKSLQDTIEFASIIPLDMMQHTFLAPLPGTECYEEAKTEGEFNPSWEATNTFAINFVPKGLTREDLLKYSNRLIRKFYLNFSRLLLISRHLTWRQLWAGIKTLFGFF